MRIVFIGTGDIGIPTLEALLAAGAQHVVGVVTQPDRPAGREMKLHPSPIKVLASRHFLPIFQPERIKEKSAIDQIRFLRPDVIVVIAYGQILPAGVLRAPAVACLNLHAALLPRHRGAAPIQAAIEAGDAVTGITVMHMAAGLDTGDILLKKSIRIRRRETGGSLHDRLAELAPGALLEALQLLKNGSAPRLPQDESQATYAPKLTRETGRIDWSRPAREIDRKIRAMNPWPGAFTTLPAANGEGRKLKVFTTISSRKKWGHPGEVLRTDKHGLLVSCGEGALLLREVQLEGKKRMAARDFLLGTLVPTGAILGERAS